MRNIHIYPSPFTHESRILREASTLRAKLGVTEIDLIGVETAGLPAEEPVADGTTIRRFGPAKGRGAMKAVRHLMWCLNVLWFCVRRRPRIVNCHSLPVLPIGVLAKWLTGSRLVYDAHELETETGGSSLRRRMIGRVIERACIGLAELIIVVSPGIEDWYAARYGKRPIVTVLNTPRYRPPAAKPAHFDAFRGPEGRTKVVLYQGVFSAGRGLEAIAGAAKALDEAGYAVVLMGYGPLEEDIKRDENVAGGHLHLHPAVSPQVVLDYTGSADIGLCLIEDICLSYRLSLPNKLFEYAMARIPVVASDLPEIRKVLEEGRIGTCIGSWDAAGIVHAVRHADALRGAELEERLEQVARQYSWEVQEERMCNAYRNHVLAGAA
jgi:glycosyltransferase involved in cell wall biosynthesis